MAPPRKKQRTSTPIPPSTPSASSPAAQHTTRTSPAPTDQWTPTQETALFKLLIHTKPTGLHKHMHMLSIYNALCSQGHVRPPSSISAAATTTPHLRIPHIWSKLSMLYDLAALDEREDAWRFGNLRYDDEGDIAASSTPSSANSDEKAQLHGGSWSREFRLDGKREERHGGPVAEELLFDGGVDEELAMDLGERMFDRRLAVGGEGSEASASPSRGEAAGDEEAESPAAGAEGGTRAGRRRGRGGTTARRGQSQAQQGHGAVAARRGSRGSRTTATTTTATTSEVEGGSEGDNDAEGGRQAAVPARSTRGANARGKVEKEKGPGKPQGGRR